MRAPSRLRDDMPRGRHPASEAADHEGAIPPQRRRTTRAPSRLRDGGPRGRHPPQRRHATRAPSRLRDGGPRGRHPASETTDHEGTIPPQRRHATRAPSRLRDDMPRGRHPASETADHEAIAVLGSTLGQVHLAASSEWRLRVWYKPLREETELDERLARVGRGGVVDSGLTSVLTSQLNRLTSQLKRYSPASVPESIQNTW